MFFNSFAVSTLGLRVHKHLLSKGWRMQHVNPANVVRRFNRCRVVAFLCKNFRTWKKCQRYMRASSLIISFINVYQHVLERLATAVMMLGKSEAGPLFPAWFCVEVFALIQHYSAFEVEQILRDKDRFHADLTNGLKKILALELNSCILYRFVFHVFYSTKLHSCKVDCEQETVEAQCDWCGSPLTLTPEEVRSIEFLRMLQDADNHLGGCITLKCRSTGPFVLVRQPQWRNYKNASSQNYSHAACSQTTAITFVSMTSRNDKHLQRSSKML